MMEKYVDSEGMILGKLCWMNGTCCEGNFIKYLKIPKEYVSIPSGEIIFTEEGIKYLKDTYSVEYSNLDYYKAVYPLSLDERENEIKKLNKLIELMKC